VSTIDLNSPPPQHKFKVAIEREETDGERTVRLVKDLALFATALGLVIVIALLCLDALRSATTSADEKKWAMSILSAVTAGLIGYLVKR
jgi:hypothetical protein